MKNALPPSVSASLGTISVCIKNGNLPLAGAACFSRPMKKGVSEVRENATLLNIEGLRLISSLAIVFDHFLVYPLHRQPLNNNLGIFVDLFFVISGVVIASAYGNRVSTPAEYGLFIQRRFARLYPLHLATMTIYVLIAAVAAAGLFRVDNAQRYDWTTLIPYLTLTQSWGAHGAIAWNGVTWSISAEMFAYLLVPMLLCPLRPNPRTAFLTVALVAITCAVGSDELFGRPFVRLVTQLAQLRALPSFVFGLSLAMHKDWLISHVPAGAASVGFWIGALGLALCLGLGTYPYVMLACVWLLVAAAYRCDLGGVLTPAGGKLISDQGRLTYSIYLIHPVVATIWLAAIGKRLFDRVPGGPWIEVTVGFFLVFSLSALSYRFFEEPLRKRLGRPLYRVRDSRSGALT
jgi:peptidoglycan/LPS O-acetylase OafA/YrhL